MSANIIQGRSFWDEVFRNLCDIHGDEINVQFTSVC